MFVQLTIPILALGHKYVENEPATRLRSSRANVSILIYHPQYKEDRFIRPSDIFLRNLSGREVDEGNKERAATAVELVPSFWNNHGASCLKY